MKRISTFLFLAVLFFAFSAIAQQRETGLNLGPDQNVVPAAENAKWLTKEAKRPNLGANYKSVFFFEDFEAPTEAGALPEGWVQKRTTNLNDEPVTDAVSPMWFRNSATYGFENWGDYVYKGVGSMATGYTAPDFTWAITPEFAIPDEEGDVSLSYWVWYFNDADWTTNYHVRIKYDGAWTNLFSVIGTPDNSNVYDAPVVQSLNAFKGKTVQIAFVYEYTDGYQMAIDELFVGKELENDFGVAGFTIFPTHGLLPGAEVAVAADVFANGTNPGTVDVALKVNGQTVATHTTGTLNSEGEAEFVLFTWTPTQYGDYTVEIVLPDDDFVGNNVLGDDVYVNHYVNLAEDFENFEFDELGIPELIFPPVGWSVNDAAWVFETEQWPIFDGVSAALSGRALETEKALITPAVAITDQDDFISFYLEGVNNSVTVEGVVQGFSTFQLKYGASATGPWTDLGDAIPFENQYDEEDNLIQTANGIRFVNYDISDLPAGSYYFAFTTTSTFDLIVGETVYRSWVMVDNVLVSQDPANATIPVFYQITIPLAEGDVPYKYFVVEDTPSWDMGEWVGDPNRMVTVTGDAVIEDVWGQQPAVDKDGVSISETLHMITFKVDMADAMVGEVAFDPAIHSVFIAGDFGGDFSWQQPGSQPLLEMTLQGSVVPVSVQEIDAKLNSFRLFPNPAATSVMINADFNINAVEVFDLTGRKVHEQVVNDNQYRMNTSSFENGIYIVRISSDNVTATQKLHITK